jgi:hypothetical protein
MGRQWPGAGSQAGGVDSAGRGLNWSGCSPRQQQLLRYSFWAAAVS